jgi:uncharacterized membrane-anchored protein
VTILLHALVSSPQGGVAVSAWVFGHQVFDLLGLLLHPATFYAWLYVLTLSQVSTAGHRLSDIQVSCNTARYLHLLYDICYFIMICNRPLCAHAVASEHDRPEPVLFYAAYH